MNGELNGNGRIWDSWRIAFAATTILAALALFLAAYLYTRVNKSAEQARELAASNHALVCSLGDLVQLGGGSIAQATAGPTRHLRAEKDFLLSIYDARCPLIVKYPAIERQIVETLSAVRTELADRAGP